MDADSAPAIARRLRPEVALRREGAAARISFAHWETSFPLDTANAADFDELFRHRTLTRAAQGGSGPAIARLLEAQGCFLSLAADEVPLRDVVLLIQPIRSLLYAQYYAHPLWARIGSGKASMAEVAGWAIHNYHISRSAGVIAARMASRSEDAAAREFFRTDALEEYWHCDAFYFVDGGNLALDRESLKQYVPLPASTAFEDVALRAADENWLGHLLIAYFQESSIVFYKDSETFYDTVEKQYGLDGFFAGWRRHMKLDLDHGHAEGLASRFASDLRVSRRSIDCAIRYLQLAHFFLLRALDQVGAETGSAPDAVARRQPRAFTVAAGQYGPSSNGTGWQGRLLAGLKDAAIRGLGFARSHDEIIAAGRLAASLERVAILPAPDRLHPWHCAVRNFLVERASNPLLLFAMAGEIYDVLEMSDGEDKREIARLRRELETGISAPAADMAKVECGRLRELVALAAAEEAIAPLLVFDGGQAVPAAGEP